MRDMLTLRCGEGLGDPDTLVCLVVMSVGVGSCFSLTDCNSAEMAPQLPSCFLGHFKFNSCLVEIENQETRGNDTTIPDSFLIILQRQVSAYSWIPNNTPGGKGLNASLKDTSLWSDL